MASIADIFIEKWQEKKQPVIIYSDMHLISDFVLSGAIETAERLKKPLASETLHPAQMEMFNAYRRREISLQDAANYLAGTDRKESGLGTPVYFMGKERGVNFYTALLTAQDRGLQIFPLGTVHGTLAGAKNPRTTQQLDNKAIHEEKVNVKSFVHFKNNVENSSAWQSNPYQVYKNFQDRVLRDYSKLHPFQQQGVNILFARETNTLEAVTSNYRKLYGLLQPEWIEKENVRRAMETEYGGAYRGLFTPQLDPEARLSYDGVIADKILEAKEKYGSGPVVMIGGNHVTHNRTLGGDIDTHLRAKGVDSLIADIRPANDIPCPVNICDGVVKGFALREGIKSDFTRSAAERAADPNRFTITVDTSSVDSSGNYVRPSGGAGIGSGTR